jgi:hypothetical protein
MYKIWAKIYKGDKIKKSQLFEFEGSFDGNRFFDDLSQICTELDIATPLLLSTHKKNFSEFNVTYFLQRDFVEEIGFSRFELQYIQEKKN